MATNVESHPSEREALPAKLVREARAQFTKYNNADLSGYTWTHTHSSYPGAKNDLVVYNQAGAVAFVGREFNSQVFFWELDPEATGFV